MQVLEVSGAFVPPTDAVRGWLVGALSALGVSGRSVAGAIGANPDALNDFLRDTGRDIRLGTAHDAAAHLQQLAAARGVDLPRLTAGGRR